MMKYLRKILLFFVLASLVFAGTALAYKELEVTYPELPSVQTPTTIRTLLPDYFKYIFSFSLLVIGLVMLGSLLQGGFRYLTSVGNPSQMKDSRDQIVSAFTGGIILLGAYILLGTINPELIILRIPGITPASSAIKIFNAFNGGGDSMTLPRGEPDLSNFGKICLPWPAEGCGARSLGYNGIDPNDIDITIYTSANYSGNQAQITTSNASHFPFVAKSVKIGWKPPGVYLFSKTNFDTSSDWKIYQNNSSVLFNFENKTRSIMFKSRAGEAPYGAILHRDQSQQGLCGVFLSNNWGDIAGDWPNINQAGPLTGIRKHGEINNDEASSITVFRMNENSSPGGEVKLTGKQYVVQPLPPLPQLPVPDNIVTYEGFVKKSWPRINPASAILVDGTIENSIHSVEINGNYIVVLFETAEYGGKCEVFTHSDDDLSNNPIGRCTTLPAGITCPSIPILNWQAPCLASCVSSFMVIPTAQ